MPTKAFSDRTNDGNEDEDNDGEEDTEMDPGEDEKANDDDAVEVEQVEVEPPKQRRRTSRSTSLAANAAAAAEAASITSSKTSSKSRKKRSRIDDIAEKTAEKTDEESIVTEEKKAKRSRHGESPPPTAKKAKKEANDDDSKVAAVESDEEAAEADADDAEMDEQEETTKPKDTSASIKGTNGKDAEEEENDDDNDDEGDILELKKKKATKRPAAKKTAGRKKAVQPKGMLRPPSQQTPGKFLANNNVHPSDEADPSDELPMPNHQLLFNSGSAVAAAAASPEAATSATKTTKNQNLGQAKIAVNGSPSGTTMEAQPEEEQEEQPQEAASGTYSEYPTKAWFWFVIFLLLQATAYPFVQKTVLSGAGVISTGALHFYKRVYYKMVPLPTKKITNQTFVDEVMSVVKERQQKKRDMLRDLKEMQKLLTGGIKGMESNARDLEEDSEFLDKRVSDHKAPVEQLHEKLLRINDLLQDKADDDIQDIMKHFKEIRTALGRTDETKLLDLTSLDLWEIPEMPDACEDGEVDELNEDSEDSMSADSSDYNEASTVVDRDRLEEWLLEEVQDLVSASTDEIMKDDAISKQVRKWIALQINKDVDWEKALAKFTVDEVSKLVQKEKNKAISSQEGSLHSDVIVQQIQERLEIEIADQTGQFDYASIRNGAAVIGGGPRSTSHSLVHELPVFNRLLAHTGMRFYGHGADAALTPTDPPDALGQCWSFQSEDDLMKKRKKPRSAQDFSRGSVATLAVRLARPAYVHSVVIEHPPKERTDRIQSAIRIFRVIGYEDAEAHKGSYELGRFEYKIGVDNPRMEFSVARKLSRQDVPKLQSIALAVESTHGEPGDYACLYRFRVHGDDNQ